MKHPQYHGLRGAVLTFQATFNSDMALPLFAYSTEEQEETICFWIIERDCFVSYNEDPSSMTTDSTDSGWYSVSVHPRYVHQ